MFIQRLLLSNYDIIVLTETWLNSSILNCELFGGGYVVYRRDRETAGFSSSREGGGVLIAVNNRIGSRRLQEWESDCEDLWVLVNGSVPLALCAAYLPPPANLSIVKCFVDNFNRISDFYNSQICIFGDFNLSTLNWASVGNLSYHLSPLFQCFVDFVNLNGLKQCNNITNYMGRTLDLVLTRMLSCNVSEAIDVLCPIDPLHPPLIVDLSSIDCPKLQYNDTSRPNFYKANYDLINSFLAEVDWESLFDGCKDVNGLLVKFLEVINKAVHDFVPSSKPKTNKYPQWFTNYKSYLQNIEDGISKNPKLFWSYVKAKRGGTGAIPAVMIDGDRRVHSGSDICNAFATSFSSVASCSCPPLRNFDNKDADECWTGKLAFSSDCLSTLSISRRQIYRKLLTLNVSKGAGHDRIPPLFISRCASNLVEPLFVIFNCSLTSRIFPSIWKVAQVVPIFKSELFSNYRPISILSTLGKVFESLVCPVLQSYFSKYLNENQHGFVKGRSVNTNLVLYVEEITKHIDSNKQVDALYTDFSKAFDKVPHQLMLKKLSAYGVVGSVLSWLESYLSGRIFYVVVNGFTSTQRDINSGVPQGSHLGPILFNIFVNDLPHFIKHSVPSLYADDLKLWKVIDTEEDVPLLQSDLNALVRWCGRNGMELNIKKCNHIKFTRKLFPISSV
ncbi:uncharacterized protein LOC123666411 [Melitaea cinxia]|uniref:uncharacterized protein LOC123666411 n=1 Tax=Melitaea cinxia TaxID=113334 RepID=UPI001E26FDB5|nr:uncharacterized protein LOC123666411 [Melitaea cinxia]